MAEKGIEPVDKLKAIQAKTFAKYRNLYKQFLKNKSVELISEETGIKRNVIRSALSYMTKYNNLNFNDNEEIQLAIDKTLFRQRVLAVLHKDCQENNIRTLQLGVVKEMRKNEELIYKLKGLLNPEFIPVQGGVPSTLVIMHNMGKKSGREVIDVTPNETKEQGGDPESLALSQIKELTGD